MKLNIPGRDHPRHHFDSQPPGLYCGVGAGQFASGLRVDRHDREAAQPFIILVDQRAAADEIPLVPQLRAKGEMSVLQRIRLFVGELRRIRLPYQKHQRMPIKLHPHSVNPDAPPSTQSPPRPPRPPRHPSKTSGPIRHLVRPPKPRAPSGCLGHRLGGGVT